MPSAKTIADLKTKFLKPALTSHYEVKIPLGSLPEGIKNIGKGLNAKDQEDLNLSCMETSLPGSSLATFEVRNDYTGVTERLAHRRMYDDRIDLTFYVEGEKYTQIRYFETWINFIVGDDTRDARVGREYNYKVKFPNDYKTRMFVTKFEKNHGLNLTYTFVDTYPIAINSMPLSYGSTDILKCTVSMTYLRYIVEDDIRLQNPL